MKILYPPFLLLSIRFRNFVCFILFLFFTSPVLAQQVPFQYNFRDHLLYRNHAYFDIPYSNSLMANSLLLEKDTIAAYHYVERALNAGAFYNMFNSKTFAAVKDMFMQKHNLTIDEWVNNAQLKLSDPKTLHVETGDIDLFWQVFDKLHHKNAGEIFMNDYLLKGSKGLQTFFLVRWSGNIHNYINTLKQHENFYRSIRPLYNNINEKMQTVYTAANKLKDLYPPSFFPPIYLMVGMMTAGGTPDGGAGLLIGTEFYSMSNTTDTTGLGAWERSVIKSNEYLVPIIIHEYVHIQQKIPQSSTVLAKVINEGSADFITQLISGKNINEHIHAYGNKREKELFEKFEKEKDGTDLSYWLHNGAEALKRGIPADLGYYLGYKIVESYYNKAADKKQAVKDILEIKDFDDFYKRSGYSAKFNN